MFDSKNSEDDEGSEYYTEPEHVEVSSMLTPVDFVAGGEFDDTYDR